MTHRFAVSFQLFHQTYGLRYQVPILINVENVPIGCQPAHLSVCSKRQIHFYIMKQDMIMHSIFQLFAFKGIICQWEKHVDKAVEIQIDCTYDWNISDNACRYYGPTI